jgi:hypothetical protein
MATPQLDGWVPMGIRPGDDDWIVDWCCLGPQRFTNPRFDETIQQCLREPFNLLFRHETSLDMLRQWEWKRPGLPLAGFIFHMSRCGSTLVTQMLASLREHVVIADAAPVDHILRLPIGFESAEARAAAFRAMVTALTHPRDGSERCAFVKFDCWHTLDLRFIRRAFPGVPWIFIYRNPIEVLVSHLEHPAPWCVPGALDEIRSGVPFADAMAMPREEYCARLLATLLESALSNRDDLRAMFVNCADLPQAVFSGILDHFSVPATEQTRAVMGAAAAAFDTRLFLTRERAWHSRFASDAVRVASARWLDLLYSRLNAFSPPCLLPPAQV